MGDFTVALNPPKTFRSDNLLSTTNRISPAARGFQTSLAFKPRVFRGIRASVMPREGQPQQQQQQASSLGDALVNSPRRNDVVEAIGRTASLSNCLSETNLHATVPGLESKTRGKVWNSFFLLLFVYLFNNYWLCVVLIEKLFVMMIWQVRDIYDAGDYLVLVTTDRQSAFDRILASIPFKGQVCDFLRVLFDFLLRIWSIHACE